MVYIVVYRNVCLRLEFLRRFILSNCTMPKGQKKTKGTPELYNEVKKQVSLSLTPTAVKKLDDLAKKHRLSRSELIEQIARGSINLAQQDSFSEKYVFYPMKSISIQECEKLPETMGAFLVSDLENFAYVDSCINLKQKFSNPKFIDELKKIGGNSSGLNNYKVFWMISNNLKTILNTQNELVSQFRTSDQYERFKSTCIGGPVHNSFSSDNCYKFKPMGGVTLISHDKDSLNRNVDK